jgi:signal peptidase
MEPESTTEHTRTWRVVRFGLGTVLLVILAILVWPSSLGGCTTMTVVSGHSMEPTFHTGDLIVARCGTPAPGDIVIYQPPGLDERALIIHRIVGAGSAGGWVMQGDNNSYKDPWQPTDHDILGIALIRIPSVGSLLRAPLVWSSMLLMAAALLVWPTRALARGRRSAANTSTDAASPDQGAVSADADEKAEVSTS